MRRATLAVVGVGLLGGSVALAARRRGTVARVIGVGRDAAALERARAAGILDDAFTDIPAAASVADLVVVCTPVDLIASHVMTAAAAAKPGTLLTDVGSSKAKIVAALQGRLPSGVVFIGSHPLAGSHRNGPEHASADLFENRLVVLTPPPETDRTALADLCEFWQSLGASVRLMDAEEHDRAVALTSHLPHLLASALAGILPAELDELTATGFRDTTRLAAGLPELWSAILQANRDAVLASLARLEAQLQCFRHALAEGDRDTLDSLLESAKHARDRLDAD
jgi:prephenate dehydrogenase